VEFFDWMFRGLPAFFVAFRTVGYPSACYSFVLAEFWIERVELFDAMSMFNSNLLC